MADFRKEFPDFPAADFPSLPPGFTDSSWHNDACPSMKNETLGLLIFTDYADAAKRDLAGVKRFAVNGLDAEGFIEDCDLLLTTDEWSEVLALIASKDKPQLAHGEARAGIIEAMGGMLAKGGAQ